MTDDRDELLEAAALAIEEPDFGDLRGVLTKTKKGQREYELRRSAIEETRKGCARVIRAMKSGQGLDPLTTLSRIAALPPDSRQHELYLSDAWPLAWKGWLDIECQILCNSNSSPPETRWRVKLTDMGRAALVLNESKEPR